MGKKKNKSNKKNTKLDKQLKALTKELKVSRKKEARLMDAVEQLTEQVAALQTQITELPITELEPKSTRRGTTPRGKRGALKKKVASTKQARVPKSPAAAPPDGTEPEKVTRETPPKQAKKTAKAKPGRRRGRPRQKPAAMPGDDLTAIKGLGASIDGLLRAAGITTYRELAQLPPSQFREILQQAGPRYKNKDPQPWIDAAAKLAIK
jgi:predicted flap endonuclease-1-like 5' DNA nuclease